MTTKKYDLYIGRWQPFHNGHYWLIRQALNAGRNVLIGVRDTELSQADPYTVEERGQMIAKVFASYKDRVRILPMPDIAAVRYGRGVGYAVELQPDIPSDIDGISATQIRELRLAQDDSWKQKVPAAVSALLDEWG